MMSRIVVAVIGLYRRFVSPLFPPSCRYHPTCSEFAAEAIRLHGAARGSLLALRRIGRCHPWASGGVDHVPQREA